MRSTIHEMRNQLAVAVANIEAFIDGKLEPTPNRLGAVLRALRKLDGLMNNVRAIAPAATKTEIRAVDVCDLVLNETIAIEAFAHAAGVTLDIRRRQHVHPECAVFYCDPPQVRQVVKNVLLNAIKYTSAGGCVKVDCHRVPGVLAVEISDNGPGVARTERESIFERGVRGIAAGAAPGSAIGLANVRAIVDAHGGSVEVDDSKLTGARFNIRLPGISSPACASCAEHSPLLHTSITPRG